VGGKVRFGHAGSDTFVISFEHVPPWRQTPDPLGPTYTFQLVLHANGYIEFLYGPLGPMPGRWSAGASFDGARGQSLACYRGDALASGTVWRLRNQPASSLWLGVTTAGLLLPPGAASRFDVVLSGYGYSAWHPDPFAGVVALQTNDPIRPSVDLMAKAAVGPPADTVLLPLFTR
jgi:hypothetical protein